MERRFSTLDFALRRVEEAMRRHGQDSLIQTKAGAKLPNVGIVAAGSLARVSEHLAVVFNGLKISKRELDTLTGALLACSQAMLCHALVQKQISFLFFCTGGRWS